MNAEVQKVTDALLGEILLAQFYYDREDRVPEIGHTWAWEWIVTRVDSEKMDNMWCAMVYGKFRNANNGDTGQTEKG